MKPYEFRQGVIKDLSKSYGLSYQTCKDLDIRVVEFGVEHLGVQYPPKPCISFRYYDPNPWGEKIKYKLPEDAEDDKTYRFPNAGGKMPLYLQHKWTEGCDTRTLLIAEGEGCAAAYYEDTGGRKPVVSPPTGAKGAIDCIKQNMDFILRFEKIVVCFDNDETGQKWAKEVAKILPAGRTYIGRPGKHKDIREAHLKGDVKTVQWIAENAEQFKPDGIFTLSDIKSEILLPPEQGRPWFDQRLTDLTYGRRKGETYVFGAGTGIGKTDWFTQSIAFDVLTLGIKTGVIYLEQPPSETGKRLAGKVAGRSFHIPDGSWTQEELEETVDLLEATGNLVLGGNFASAAWPDIEARIRFMKHSLSVEHLYLDHLTALADTKNEQESVSTLIKAIALLCQELGMIFHVISHLATPEGKSHEEGAKVLPKHFRGSRAIQYWAHYMFGLERNTQSEDPEEILYTTFRIVKDRYTGRASGRFFHYRYNRANGLLEPSEPYVSKGSDGQSSSQIEDYSELGF